MQKNRNMENKPRRVPLFTRGISQSKNSAGNKDTEKKDKRSTKFGNYPAPLGQ